MTTMDASLRLKLVNQIKGGAKEAKADLAGIKAEAEKLGATRGADKLEKSVDKLGKGSRRTRKEVADLKGAAEKLGTTRAPDKLEKSIEKLGTGSRKAKRDVLDLRSATEALGRSGGADRAARDVEKIGQAARKSKSEVDQLRKGREALGTGKAGGTGGDTARHGGGGVSARDAAMGAGLVGAGARVLAPLGAGYTAKKAFDQSVNFDKAWAEVVKKVDGTPEQMEALKKTVRNLALELGIPRAQVAAQAAEAGATGYTIDQIPIFLRLAAKSSAAWDMDPREASKFLGFSGVTHKADLARLEEIGNKANLMADKGSSSERDVLDMYLKAGPAAKLAGFSEDATLAFLTAGRSGGMEPDVVARWFASFSGALRTAAIKPKHVAEGFKLLGLTPKQVTRGMQKDAAGTALDIFKRLENSPKGIEAASMLFGDGWWDETMRAKDGIKEILKNIELLKNPANYAGSMDKSLAIQLATAEASLNRLNELVSRIGEGITGWSLAPFSRAVDALIANFQDMETRASWLERWSEENRAYLEAKGEVVPVKPGEAVAPAASPNIFGGITEKITGSQESFSTQLWEKLFGRSGERSNDLASAGERGRAAAAKDIRDLIKQRQQLDDIRSHPEWTPGATADVDAQIQATNRKLIDALGRPNLGPIARKEMEDFVASINAEGERATEAARRIADELMRILSINARPTITPQMGPAGEAAPGKQSSVSPTINQSISGTDPRAVARHAQREQDRSIRRTRMAALHDLGAWA